MKKTKRALLLSIISIALCVLMLGGIIAAGYNALSNNNVLSPSVDKENNLPVVKPKEDIGSSASAKVEVTDDNKTVANVELESEDGEISASIPSGTLLNEGVNKVTLTVEKIDNSEANIEINDNEVTVSYNVHIEGVSSDNQTPIKVYIKELLPVGLNMGNYKFYHVENGETVEMTLLGDNEPVHNNFDYDSTTGDCVLYLASFSEVAAVTDTVNAWEGSYDYELKTEDGTYIISSADELAGLGDLISNDSATYGSASYKLIADVNFGGEASEYVFYPIGYHKVAVDDNGDKLTNSAGENYYVYGGAFSGSFDGNGHKVSGIYQNTWSMDGNYDNGYWNSAMGLFGYVNGGTIQNLTVDSFSSDGEFTPTGCVAAYAVNSTFKNIAITNCNPRVYNTGNGGIVGIGGNSTDTESYSLNFENITVDNSNKISALWGSWDVACGGLMGMFRGNGLVNFTNCHVAAQIDVNNDVCANYQYYAYRYAGMMIGSIRKNLPADANGHIYPDMTGISASGCTVHFGDWNDYYYCELVANTIASYTHDYQFSRLTQVKAVNGTTITYLDGTEGTVPASGRYNYVVVNGTHATENATCYHFVDGRVHNHNDYNNDGIDDYQTINGVSQLVENNQHIYLEFNQLFTGYGWGVTSKGLTDFEGVTNIDVQLSDKEKSEVKFESLFTGDFLYRVGNKNPVSLSSLFASKDGVTINSSGVWVTITPVDENSSASGTFSANNDAWASGTIQFNGTGVVKVTIQDYNYCIPTELYLEVVDAKNVTSASFSGNTVLLQDVSTSSTLGASGVIYGNGFTVNMENAPISEKNGAVFHLYDGAVLKNLGIVGKEFTSVALNVNDTNYGVSTVRAWGTATIENCYISGCRSALSVTGTELTIKDSVIANGVYANVDFRSGILNLHNVTTVNEPHAVDDTTILGLGIVGNMTASAGRQLNITGTLTQYNWVSQADCSNIKASGISDIFNSVFTEDKYASLRYTYDGTTYVNTGILSLCSDFGASAVTGVPSNYGGMNVSATISGVSVNGYVWAPNQAGTLTDNDMKYHDTEYQWTANNQGTSYIPPAFNFTNAGLTTEDGIVQIEYESGSSYTLSADTIKMLFTATKYGKELSYKITMNGTDYTGKDIVFNEAASKTYTIIFTITDNIVYDKDGKLTNTTYEITKELKVFAKVVDKGADAPSFTFYYGTNGSASAGTPHTTQPTNSYTSTITQADDAYYIMPNVNATTANAIGSQTVGGVTIYYPIVDGINVRSGNTMDYDFTRYYPIFKAVKISDNGTEYTYSGTTEMPATVAWESATIDSGNGASALNSGFGLYNDKYLCKIQTKAGDAEAGGTSVVKFSYTALDGNTYYYYVGFRFYDENEGGICVTADTLVSMADGSQKRVDQVTYEDELLVWDFFNGTYATVPASIIFYHGDHLQNVLKLNFADGTSVKVINNHGFFDVEENKFVFIDEENAESFIGHSFVKVDGDSYSFVQFESFETIEEYTGSYSIQTAMHNNFVVEGMFSITMPAYDGWFDYFEIGDNMKYDEAKMQEDIEKYGLYTYDDFSEYVTYEQFIAFSGPYLKVLVGRGVVTFDEILTLIFEYVK